jgi:hypothetical protein
VVLLVMLVVALVLALGAVGYALMTPRAVEPPPVAPAPAPAPAAAAPAPVAPAAPAQARMIDVTSEPSGSEVWEGSTLLGVTPCKVDHPDHAPTPRTFTLKLNGYRDEAVEMVDPKVPLRATLSKAAAAAPPPKPNRPAPQPKAADGILIER